MKKSSRVLYIDKPILSEMISNVESTPDECCGFLFGHETQEDRTIVTTMAAKNVAEGDKHCRFEIAPKDYLSAENFAAQNNLYLLGIYHSHPNHPALPSAFDSAAAQPYFSYIIISVMHEKFAAIRSWRLDNDLHFVEEKIDRFINQSSK